MCLNNFCCFFSISASVLICISESTSASGIFGVITVASGNNLLFNVLMASSLISLAPLVATMTRIYDNIFA